jgi:AraC family transcriptional regulator, regulatory protein of adaptative response / methylated-DNA-[protein]-cysteine methyltransferase
MTALNGYLASKLRRLDLPVDAQGTAFQLLVWRYLRAVLVPCHRVVRGTGELSGYRWGVNRKRELLRLEAE